MAEPVPYDQDFAAVQDYLKTGRLNRRLLWQAFRSVLLDPLFFPLVYMTGPLGYALRRLVYGRLLERLGRGALIDVGVTMHGCRHIAIGEMAWIDSYVTLVAPYGRIAIGKRVHVATNCVLLGAGTIEIRDYVGLAPRVMVLSSTEYPVPGKRMCGPMIPIEDRGLKQGPVVLEKDAFVGSNSIIMPGVTVGEGAVVSANSIVNRDVPPWTIVFGSPARKIGRRAPVTVPDR